MDKIPGLWIRIRIRIGSKFSDFVDPDPYWESGSRGKKINKFQWKTVLFSYFFKKILPLKMYKIALTTFWTKLWWITLVFLIWFESNFDFKKIRIWIEQKWWIQIRIKSIRIHNPVRYTVKLKLLCNQLLCMSNKFPIDAPKSWSLNFSSLPISDPCTFTIAHFERGY
jgi:hypothetical protein